MTPVTLTLPTSLLRRFRERAADMLPHAAEPFHLALKCAVAETMATHASLERLEAPPETLVPCLTVHSAVPPVAATFVSLLAQESGLTVVQAWHRVVLEFVEREVSCLPAGARREAA